MIDQRGIYCLVGCVLVNLTFGTFYSVGNVMPYIASYMKQSSDSKITTEYGAFITSSFLLGQGLFLIVGAWIEHQYNSRIAIIVGCIIHSCSTFMTILAVKHSFALVVLFYGFGCGLGTGSAYIAAIIAAQKWYPSYKGLFTGLIVAGFGLGGLVFTNLQTLYMNPNNSPLINESYPADVNARVPHLFLYMGIIFAILQAIGCALAYPPPHSSSEIQATVVSDDALPDLRSYNDIFRYKLFYITGLIMILIAPGVTFVNSLGKKYGQIYINDDNFLAIVISICAVGNALGRVTWGILLDYFSFSTCLTGDIGLFAIFITLFPFEFVLKSKAIYFLVMIGLFFGFSGGFVLWPVFTEQVFGGKYSGMVYGTLYVLLAISSTLTSILIQVVLSPILQDPESKKLGNRLAPCIVIAIMFIAALSVYYLCLPTKRIENAVYRRKEAEKNRAKETLYQREDLYPLKNVPPPTQLGSYLSKENSLGSIVRFRAEEKPKNKLQTFS